MRKSKKEGIVHKNGCEYGVWASCTECGKHKSRCKIGRCKECRKLDKFCWNKGLVGEDYLKHFKVKPKPPIHYGENSNFWKGGVTNLTDKIRQSLKYKEWRTSIFKRDNYKCTDKSCTSNSHKLNADHIIPFCEILFINNINTFEDAMLCSNLWDLNNGRTLCVSCHKNTDTYLSKSITRMKKIRKEEKEGIKADNYFKI